MKNFIYAMKNLLKNFFNWRGRCSKKEYMWSWAGILAVNASLVCKKKILLFPAVFSVYSYQDLISKIMGSATLIWNIIMFFPILFATMRRYHDSGKAGWKALLFNGLSLICIVQGFVIGCLALVAVVFGGGYMVTGGNDVHMSGLLKVVIPSAFIFLVGIGFAILNIKYILQPSDPEENRYGKLMPFN